MLMVHDLQLLQSGNHLVKAFRVYIDQTHVLSRLHSFEERLTWLIAYILDTVFRTWLQHVLSIYAEAV